MYRPAGADSQAYSNCRVFQVFQSARPRSPVTAFAARTTPRGSKMVNRSKQIPRTFAERRLVGAGAATAAGAKALPPRPVKESRLVNWRRNMALVLRRPGPPSIADPGKSALHFCLGGGYVCG